MKKMEKETFNLNENFSFNSENQDAFLLKGFAIHPGIFNQVVEVPEEELGNCAKTLENAKLMKDHNYSVDNIIGKINTADITFDEKNGLKGVHYSAQIDDSCTDLIKKVKNRLVDAVSIGFKYEPICSTCGKSFWECNHWFGDEDDTHIVAKNMSVHELSLVPFGADSDASVAPGNFKAEQIKEKFQKKKSDFMTEEKIIELQTQLAAMTQEKESVKKELEETISKLNKELEDVKFEKQENNSTLTKELEAFKEEFNKQAKELEAFKEEANKRHEAELDAKRKTVTELAEKLGLQETIEDVDEMEEGFLDRTLTMLKGIEKKLDKPAKFNENQDDDRYVRDDNSEPNDVGRFSAVHKYFPMSQKLNNGE